MIAPRGTDLHNHVIPGVDDGAIDAEEALAGLRALREQGVGTVVATPHVDASLTEHPPALARRLAEIDEGWSELTRALEREAVDGLRVQRGVELRLDTPNPDVGDERLRLAGGPTVLVEFSLAVVPPRSEHVLFGISREGYVPLVAHPERYGSIDMPLLDVWRSAGAHLQVNAGSILGRYGSRARQVALELLERGWVACLSSDYHSRGRPRLAEARELLDGLGAEEQADLLLRVNTERLARGEVPVPVPPIRRPGLFGRMLARLK